ncbi:MAG TPA: bL35 family ribosomal protein [Planctomycetota bacterium]|jgi:ribosomal protein L35|nr:bL35 family ribosomal protein [Planctomycetota bacterium]
MPKMKSKGAVKKRFVVTKKGRVKCSRPARGHMHASKSASARRRLRERIVLPTSWGNMMRRMMGS